MKFHSLSSLVGGLLALSAALFLPACGGGGAIGNPAVTGSVSITPNSGTIYAGIPFTFQVLGGRRPYALSSSEPSVLSVPSSIDGNSFEVVAANPGVVDTGLQPGDLPVRTVIITVRSGDGLQSTATMKVGQNFLTGYSISLSPLTCPIPSASASTTLSACAGGQTAVQLSAVFAGNLRGDHAFQLQALKGPFSFVFPSGAVGNTINVTSDHTGRITAIIQVDANAATQIAVLRVIDVETGVYADHAFVITGNAGNGTLTAIPSTITFTGTLTTDCGAGSGSFLVFDGTPPYRAVSTLPGITVNLISNSNPGVFNVTMGFGGTPPCNSGIIVVTDATGARATVTVESKPGAGAPPVPAKFTVAPDAITLGCGESGSVTVVGGSGSYAANSSSANVTTAVAGGTVTITRAGPVAPGTGSLDSTVSITDGATIGTVTVTAPLTCP